MPDPPTYPKHNHPGKTLSSTMGGQDAPLSRRTSGRFGSQSEDGRSRPRARTRRYAELHCKSNFSFLRGASHPEQLAERAAELGYVALAITDRNTLAGVVRMHCAAKACGLKLLIGAEITPADAPPITLYATDRAAYGRLCRIITQGRLRSIKGSCSVTLADIDEWNDGLIAAVHGHELRHFAHVHRSADPSPKRQRGVLSSDARLNPPLAQAGPPIACAPGSDDENIGSGTKNCIHAYRDIFGDRLYLTASVHGGADDERRLAELSALARSTGLPMVASNDVHYHDPQQRFLQDVLTCIREHCTLEGAGTRLFANAERHLKPIEEMERLFVDYPEAIARTLEIADRCRFSLDELHYEYPEALCPPGRLLHDYLAELTWAGAAGHYPGGVPDKVREVIEHELKLIRELEYEPYFLTVWDIVKFARSRNILCQGRGSAANSAVCYCLGITSVDPDRIDLLFERFISAERNEPPDIDVDFEHERREEVFQYIYNKYGREHAGIVAEVITYRPRSAIRDVGKALGLSLDRVGALAKKQEWWDKDALPDAFVREVGFDPADRTLRMLRKLVRQIVGFPRHLSQHVGGFVITRGPLCEMVPIENAAMPDRTFIEWDKDDIDALGILKIDCLALGMLTAIQKCFHFVKTELRITNYELRNRAGNLLGAPGHQCTPPTRAAGFSLRGRAQPDRAAGFSLRGYSTADPMFKGPETPRGLPQGGFAAPAAQDDQNRQSTIDNRQFESLRASPSCLRPSVPPCLSLTSIPPEDPAVYDMICRADTVGVFQIESRAQMSMLPRLKPRCFYDLVIEVAIVRPGPIQGGMVHPFLRRRCGEEPVTYPNAAIKEVLKRTLGVPLFQEQAMRLAVVAGGFTPGEADQLRRAMGAWRRHGDLSRLGERLIAGMKKNGLSEEFAKRCYDQICGFGEYGFPESHAASFSLLVYVSAWLKRYHPAAFCAAILNSLPMGFYQPAQLVRDAKEHGVRVLPVDVNHSGYDCRLEARRDEGTKGRRDQGNNAGCHGETTPSRRLQPARSCEISKSSNTGTTARAAAMRLCRARGSAHLADDSSLWGLDGPAVRLGMRLVKGISQAKVEGIERAQRDRPFTSVADLAYRSGASRAVLARLAAADAMRSVGLGRREALWQVLALDISRGSACGGLEIAPRFAKCQRRTPGNVPPMFEGYEPVEPKATLPQPSLADVVLADYDTMGLSLTAHPISLVRGELERLGVSQARVLKHARPGQRLSVGGLVLVRQRPSTAKGIVFCTLEDETGVANLIIRPAVYERFRATARSAVALVAEGRVERKGEVIHLQVSRLTDMSKSLASLSSVSRDFH